MHPSIYTALIGTAVVSAPLHAQASAVALRGFRVEANAGTDRFHSADTRRSKFGYGATIGADVSISRLVLGVEGSYWRDSGKITNCLTGGAGTFCSTSGQRELGAAVRAGFAITPQLLAFGKVGYVSDRQREIFTSSGQTFYVNGQFVAGPPSSDLKFDESGYDVGGGLEYTFQNHVFADAQYVHARYRNRNSRDRAMLGVGYRF